MNTSVQTASKSSVSLLSLPWKGMAVLMGVIFMLSGLIKLNDPVGTKIKLEEYFEVFAGDVPGLSRFFLGFIPYTLAFSLLLCLLEVVLGLALLLRFRMVYTLRLVLGLVVFFTFLTLYSAYFNKVTDCGCFGDALKLKPWQSFGKDVVLLLTTLVLLTRIRALPPLLSPRTSVVLLAISTVAGLATGLGSIFYLPPIDFLPYKEGNNIPQLRKPSAPYRYLYVMEKEGKSYEFEEYIQDTTLQFKSMTLLNPEAQPKIKDYALWNGNEDYTQQSLEGAKLFIVSQQMNEAAPGSFQRISQLLKEIRTLPVNPLLLTSSDEGTVESYRHEYQLSIPYYFADGTVLKTMIRTNPGLMLIQNGTVIKKWSYMALPDARSLKNLLKTPRP
jgi:hypothetical protein